MAGAGASSSVSFATNPPGAMPVQAAGVNDVTARFAPANTRQAMQSLVAEVGQRGQWTLVNFYADWCISCKVMARLLRARQGA